MSLHRTVEGVFLTNTAIWTGTIDGSPFVAQQIHSGPMAPRTWRWRHLRRSGTSSSLQEAVLAAKTPAPTAIRPTTDIVRDLREYAEMLRNAFAEFGDSSEASRALLRDEFRADAAADEIERLRKLVGGAR